MNGPTTDKFQRFPIADIKCTDGYYRRLHEFDHGGVSAIAAAAHAGSLDLSQG
jgi:hypothetical protein